MIFICFCFRVSNSEKNWKLKKVRREDFIVALLFIFHSTSAVLLWTMMTTTPTCCCSMGTTAVECDSEISSFCSFCFFLVPCPALITVGSGEWPDAPVRSDPAPALIYCCTALNYDPHIIYNRLLYTNYTQVAGRAGVTSHHIAHRLEIIKGTKGPWFIVTCVYFFVF